jgi:hypothetical protein
MTDKRSRTVWERLEPVTRDEDLDGTLQGRLADPLWLLSRQRQFGEFAGEDAGSPVNVHIDYEQDDLTGISLGETTRPYEPRSEPPLEALIEREPVAATPGPDLEEIRSEHGLQMLAPLRAAVTDDPEAPDHATRAEAGMNFLDRLRRAMDDQGASSLPTPDWFDDRLHLERPPVADAPARRFADVFDRADGSARGLDGYILFLALRVAEPNVADPDQSTDWSRLERPVTTFFDNPPVDVKKSLFTDVAERFAEWYAALYDEPGAPEDAWNPDRLEYDAAVSTSASQAASTFELAEYTGGRLDWDDFTVTDGSLLPIDDDENGTDTADGSDDGTSEPDDGGADDGDENEGAHCTHESIDDSSLTVEEARERTELSVLPTKTTFRGMPASRLWEMEDANVDLASVSAAADDLGRMFMLEFALVAGDDWFSLPIEAPVGSVTRITELYVEDTFQQTTASVPATTNRSDAANWDMYTFDLPSVDEPGLFLPPVLGTSRSGEVIESVRYGRDEMANLVFGIESTVESAIGDPLDREAFRAPALEIADFDRADQGTSGSEAARSESINLTNPGDDTLSVDGWELRVEDPTDGSETTVPLPTFEIPTDGSVQLVTGPGVTTDDQVHLDRTAPLLSDRSVITVHRPTDDGMGLVTVEPVNPTALTGLDEYYLANEVDDHWFPYVPTTSGVPQRFDLGLLLDADALSDTLEAVPRPLGRILDPDASIYGEELSRTGAVVERSYQASQWLDGRDHVWSSRSVSPGSGEVSSGLQFDFLDRSDDS